MASSGDSGFDGFSEEFPFLTIKSPFLFKNIPSILSRYCLLLNEIVKSMLLSCAGVADAIPPDPLKDIVLFDSNNVLFWNPVIKELTSTFGLKSITSPR